MVTIAARILSSEEVRIETVVCGLSRMNQKGLYFLKTIT